MDIQRLGKMKAILGEGPYWDWEEGVLYSVDIHGKAILCYNPKDNSYTSWETPVQPSALTRTKDGRIIAALADGFYDFDPDLGVFELIAKVDFDHEEEQINDAKVDRQGRFVGGATNNQSGRAVSGLYSFDGEKVTKLDEGFTNCNGPCWSPDGSTFYIADTGPNILYAYDYDTATGAVSNKRVFADISEINGSPDGATVDAQGRVWWTFIMGDGELIGFNPDGTIYQRISTGIKWMTSIQFGGKDFNTAYLTSLDPAGVGLPESDPTGGALWSINGLQTTGLPEPLAFPATQPQGATKAQ